MKFYLTVFAAMLAVATCAPAVADNVVADASTTTADIQAPSDQSKAFICVERGHTCHKDVHLCCKGDSCQEQTDGKYKCEKDPSQ